jgi:hypothetical protein
VDGGGSMTAGGTEITCSACGTVFLFGYGMKIKISDFKCTGCGVNLWDQVMRDAEEVTG